MTLFSVIQLNNNLNNMENPFATLLEKLQILSEDVKAIKQQLNNGMPIAEPDVGDITLAMKILGVTRSTVYALVNQAKIPSMKRGKRLYFSRQALLEYIIEGKKPTFTERVKNLRLGKGRS